MNHPVAVVANDPDIFPVARSAIHERNDMVCIQKSRQHLFFCSAAHFAKTATELCDQLPVSLWTTSTWLVPIANKSAMAIATRTSVISDMLISPWNFHVFHEVLTRLAPAMMAVVHVQNSSLLKSSNSEKRWAAAVCLRSIRSRIRQRDPSNTQPIGSRFS